MEKILSLIIPSYNMEKYIERCLLSLVCQHMDRMEVLVINDGSKDRTSEIAHRFQDKYPGTFIVIDKQNGNYGSCVNKGLSMATGKYIKVLDADDSFENNNFDKFLVFLSENDADLVISDYVITNMEGKITTERTFPYETSTSLPIDKVCITKDFLGLAMHALAYNRRVFNGLDYKQTEGISYTDQEWIFLPMTKVETVVYFNQVVYRYFLGRPGQTMNANVIAKSLSHYDKIMVNRLNVVLKSKFLVSDNMKTYLLHKSLLLASFIYRATLLRKLYPLERLIEMDKLIEKSYPMLYKALAAEKMKGADYYYIQAFRKRHQYAPWYIVAIYKLTYKIFHGSNCVQNNYLKNMVAGFRLRIVNRGGVIRRSQFECKLFDVAFLEERRAA